MEVQDINKGTLYLVTTPIGNYLDMTLRALRTLKECDIIVCEEYKEATRLLKFFDIKKDLLQLNEHNEQEEAEKIALEILNGKKIALISDCGTPLFADPGKLLLEKCIEFIKEDELIEVTPISIRMCKKVKGQAGHRV